MSNLSAPVEQINPSAIYSYFDVVRAWIKSPLSYEERVWLEARCRGKFRRDDVEARFDRSYKQRLNLWQPTRASLELLGGRDDVHVNKVEVALDWVFEEEDALEFAYGFADQYLVKKYHRREHGINYFKETRYTGPPRVRTKIVLYPDKPSRITGEVHCLHFDFRMLNRDAVRRCGLTSVADLIQLDHHQFWQQRLLMCALQPRKLGRRYHNHVEGKGRRHTPWIISGRNGFAYDVDKSIGNTIIRALGSTQKVLDEYGRYFRVRDCLRQLDVRHLLPSSRSTL
jgi:hypothetical protein